MTKNAERFTGRVAEYVRYRTRYPQEVVSWLRIHCGFSDAHLVADVGAGTGMLAELFLENGNPVVAIEPNAEMRQACEQLTERYPRLTVMDAPAEATTLRDASVDFVAVGRAFHWFDRERAVAEFRRILRPGGWVVLLSNRRSKDNSPEVQAYEEVLLEFGTDYQETHRRIYGETPPLFPGGAVAREELLGEQALTLEELLGLTQSFSAAPLPGDAKYAPMQAALRALFARYQSDGMLTLATVCSVMCCQVDIG